MFFLISILFTLLAIEHYGLCGMNYLDKKNRFIDIIVLFLNGLGCHISDVLAYLKTHQTQFPTNAFFFNQCVRILFMVDCFK